MTITTKSREGESLITTLYGGLMDEAALAGVLSALYDLGYSLQSVKKIKAKEVQRVQTES